MQVHSLNENEVHNPPSFPFNYHMHITSLGMLHGLLYFRASNLASPLFISQRWMAHKIYSQNTWCHGIFESLKVQVRNKNPKSALQLLIATQHTDYNRFHSFLVSLLWTNFHISPGSKMPARCQQSQQSACASGGWVSPWKIIKAASTVRVASWWICRQYLHMIDWCSGTIWSCVGCQADFNLCVWSLL